MAQLGTCLPQSSWGKLRGCVGARRKLAGGPNSRNGGLGLPGLGKATNAEGRGGANGGSGALPQPQWSLACSLLLCAVRLCPEPDGGCGAVGARHSGASPNLRVSVTRHGRDREGHGGAPTRVDHGISGALPALHRGHPRGRGPSRVHSAPRAAAATPISARPRRSVPSLPCSQGTLCSTCPKCGALLPWPLSACSAARASRPSCPGTAVVSDGARLPRARVL